MSTIRDRGASSPQLLRQANRRALLQHALAAGTFTAADAMAATGLTRATVLGVCAELAQAGWLHEVSGDREDGTVQRGRPARHYALRARAAFLVGVDAGQHTLSVRIADLHGNELAAVRREAAVELAVADPELGAAAAETRIRSVRALIDDALAQAGASGGRKLLTVVGVPAPVDSAGYSPSGGSVYWASMNPGFVEALEGEVLVENDANLAVLAEHALAARPAGSGDVPRLGLASGAGVEPVPDHILPPDRILPADQNVAADHILQTDHIAALLMGERFGTGFVVDGRLLRGADGGAGEMRFLDDVLGDSRGADGVAALARRWSLDALAAGGTSSVLADIPADALTAVDVFAAARGGDRLAKEVLDRIATRLARITSILSSLLGVEKVVVAGAIADAIEPVLVRARLDLAEIAAPPLPQLVASTLGQDVVVRGAIELALARLRENPLDLLIPDS